MEREKNKRALSELSELAEIPKQTLINKVVEVFHSTNRDEIGIKGKVVEDRANILIIDTGKGEKKIIKHNCWFLVYVDSYKVLIEGKKIKGRLEKRIKKL